VAVVLIYRPLGLGDFLTGVPAYRALRRAFPDHRIVLAAPRALAPLAELTGAIDEVVDTAPLGPPPRGADVAVNLHGRGPQSTALLRDSGAERLIAYGDSWREDEHEVHRWCRLLRHYGIAAAESDLSLAVPAVAVTDGVTIIHPGAKSPSRRWPPVRYAAVARALSSAGHRVVVTGSAAERDLAVRVALGAGLGVRAAQPTTLGELAGLIARARLLISGDTGVAHLATAYGTPSVVLFGPVSPTRWGPPPDRPCHRAIWYGHRSEPGDRPEPGVHPALLAIDVAEVLTAAGVVDAGGPDVPVGRAISTPPASRVGPCEE